MARFPVVLTKVSNASMVASAKGEKAPSTMTLSGLTSRDSMILSGSPRNQYLVNGPTDHRGKIPISAKLMRASLMALTLSPAWTCAEEDPEKAKLE